MYLSVIAKLVSSSKTNLIDNLDQKEDQLIANVLVDYHKREDLIMLKEQSILNNYKIWKRQMSSQVKEEEEEVSKTSERRMGLKGLEDFKNRGGMQFTSVKSPEVCRNHSNFMEHFTQSVADLQKEKKQSHQRFSLQGVPSLLSSILTQSNSTQYFNSS